MPEQLSRSALEAMTPDELQAARTTGQLNAILGIPDADPTLITRASGGHMLSHSDLTELAQQGRHDLITLAHAQNRITNEGN